MVVPDPIHISELQHDQRNARLHTPRNIGMIADSLQKFGANRGIVIDEDGTVLAGNGVLEAAAQAGIEQVRVIETDGTEIIAVRVSHLTPDQKKLYAIADNRTTDLSSFDPEVLQSFMDEGLDLEQFWFPDELERVLGDAEDDSSFHSADLDNEREGGYREQYGVIVVCEDESHQKRVYDDLSAAGHNVRVVVT